MLAKIAYVVQVRAESNISIDQVIVGVTIIVRPGGSCALNNKALVLTDKEHRMATEGRGLPM